MRTIELPEDASAEDVWKTCQPMIEADYRRWVRQAAEDLLKENPEAKEQGELDDAVHDVVDGSYWTIYTFASLMALMSTRNDDAFLEDYEEAALVARDRREEPLTADKVYARLAYGALDRDLREELDRLLEARADEDEPGEEAKGPDGSGPEDGAPEP